MRPGSPDPDEPASYGAPSAQTRIEIERSGSYKLALGGDQIRFEALDQVPVSVHEAALTSNQLAAILHAFERVHFLERTDAHAERCSKPHTGKPTITIALTHTTSRTVRHDTGCVTEGLDRLLWLEAQIEDIARTHQWAPAPPPSPAPCNAFDHPHGCPPAAKLPF